MSIDIEEIDRSGLVLNPFLVRIPILNVFSEGIKWEHWPEMG